MPAARLLCLRAMSRNLGIVQFGCGPIGCSIARLASQRASLSVRGAIDIDPALVGRDVGDVAAAGGKLGAVVRGDAREALAELRPDVVFHTTGSKVAEVFDQLTLIAAAGASVVSTCEELAFPEYRDPALAERLHELALHHGVSILGTGVNPGFLMDTWPLFMSTLCADVRRVRVVRVQDASGRRVPFQRKIGAGMSVAEFDAAVAGGAFGHVGLQESAAMLAAGLGWRLDEISESIEPVLLDREVRSAHAAVPPGAVAGLKQVAVGTRGGEPAVELEFHAYLGAPRSYETVSLAGTPPLEVTIEGGTPGDIATAAIVVNSAAAVAAAAPGLYRMHQLPVAGCTA